MKCGDLEDAIYKTYSYYIKLCTRRNYDDLEIWKKEEFFEIMKKRFNQLSYDDQINFYFQIKKVFQNEISITTFLMLNENQQIAARIME